MALDGFSLRQVGLGQDNTSSQMTAQAEQASRFGKNTNIQNVQASKLSIKDDEEQEQKKKKKKRQELVDGFAEEDIEEEKIKEEPTAKPVKNFYKKKKNQSYEFLEDVAIRVNAENETIELYNKSTNKKLESLKSEDFKKLISKLNVSFGIMVNKQV